MCKSDLLAWLCSFFKKQPVITGCGFTTTDDSLTGKPKTNSGLAECHLKGELTFILVGHYIDNGKPSYRVYETESKRTITLNEELFKLLFKTN